MDNYLKHHGILGQKWGVRNGPPYPLHGYQYSRNEIQKEYTHRRIGSNNIYNKKHFDTILEADKTTLTTLSYDKDRTKNTDMFYAAHTKLDKHQYNALFNKKTDQVFPPTYKVSIDNKVLHDMKVASEDSGSRIFMDLFSNDRDFCNFVIDKSRMESRFREAIRHNFRGYNEALTVLNRIRNNPSSISENDIGTIYRLFNYVLPSDANGDARYANDVRIQRTKFFDALKEAGYGAVLDTNDAIYGGFRTTSPVIVFDMDNVVNSDIRNTSINDIIISRYITTGRKILGV